MSLFDASQVCSVAPFSLYSFFKSAVHVLCSPSPRSNIVAFAYFWSYVRDEIFTLCLCVFKFGYECFVANSVTSSRRLVVCVYG